jgi:hypothetical protein
MICVSAADIENKWVGETEKAIQRLFSLARKLSPCNIFVDEADSLFRSGKSEDRGFERNKINQIVHEMDGLKKSKTPPFVILATDFPRDLDPAVLRRVPSRVYIGLPSPDTRRQIFEILFKDEVLHSNVHLCQLVEISRGYTGSVIQAVCVQAALACDITVGDHDSRRLLKQSHLIKAFQRNAPGVSKTVLAGIRTFSKEFHAVALDSMNPEETNAHMPREFSCMECTERKNARGRNYQPRKQEIASSSQSTGLALKSRSRGDIPIESCRSKTSSESLGNETKGVALSGLDGSYQYTPLKPDIKEIRVLYIEPRKKIRSC